MIKKAMRGRQNKENIYAQDQEASLEIQQGIQIAELYKQRRSSKITRRRERIFR